jgi:hypothetical protein
MDDVTERARLDDLDRFGVQGGRENYCAFGEFSGIAPSRTGIFREADSP